MVSWSRQELYCKTNDRLQQQKTWQVEEDQRMEKLCQEHKQQLKQRHQQLGEMAFWRYNNDTDDTENEDAKQLLREKDG